MQFQIPQFIDVEDKIFGPMTLRQFLYIAGAGAISFILFFALTLPVWIGAVVLLGIIACTLAFVKYNGQTMPVILGYVLKYLWLPHFYLWHYEAPGRALPVIHDLPREQAVGHQSPLKSLLLKFNTSSGAVSR